jgi:hypothetical protein
MIASEMERAIAEGADLIHVYERITKIRPMLIVITG